MTEERFKRPAVLYQLSPDGISVTAMQGDDAGLTYDLREVTNNNLSISGTTIRNANNGRIVFNFREGDTPQIVVRGPDTFLVTNEIDPSRFNQVNLGSSQIVLVGQVSMTDGKDGVVTVPLNYIKATSIGKNLYINPDVTGNGRFSEVDSGPNGAEARLNLRNDGYRRATYDEAVVRGIASYLSKFFGPTLENLRNQGVMDENGNFFESNYELAQWIAATQEINVTPHIQTRIDLSV